MLDSKDATPDSPADLTAFAKRDYFSELLIPATARDYNADFAMVNSIEPKINIRLASQPYAIPSMVLDLTESNVLWRDCQDATCW